MKETIDDILAKMRVEKRPYGVSIDRLRDYADRIEAAAKRERTLADAMLACKGKVFPHPDPEHAPPPYPGNAAAMRLCDELIQAAYDADICSPGDLAQRVRKIKNAIGPSPQGNAAAMREALEQVLEGFDNNVLGPIGDVPNDWEIAEAKRLCKVVDAALSAPARNCDRFATRDEAIGAFLASRDATHRRIWSDECDEFIEWLFAQAEGGAE